MFIKFDLNKSQLVFNQEQLLQDKLMSQLFLDYGYRGVKFCIDFFWQGSPYSTSDEATKLKLAYENAIDWYPEEDSFGYKNPEKYLRLDSPECYCNLKIFKDCGIRMNKIFPMPELENYNALVRQEAEFRTGLSIINLTDAISSDDDDTVKKRTESIKAISLAISSSAKIRQEAEIKLQERLSPYKLASLDTFL
jgi:hypothetical protein